jgi:hypothetical protein
MGLEPMTTPINEDQNFAVGMIGILVYTASGARTHGHQIKSLALYRLSYSGSFQLLINPFYR